VDERDRDIIRRILKTRRGFTHREHVELVWNYLQIHEAGEVHRAVASGIREVAAMHGAPDKYHETITRCWVRLVALHRAESQAESFDQFIAENPGLLDRDLLTHHYSPELIRSVQARSGWAEPDLQELPSGA
jgi:hypothetical protein